MIRRRAAAAGTDEVRQGQSMQSDVCPGFDCNRVRAKDFLKKCGFTFRELSVKFEPAANISIALKINHFAMTGLRSRDSSMKIINLRIDRGHESREMRLMSKDL